MAIMLGFQPKYAGSIPATRSEKFKIKNEKFKIMIVFWILNCYFAFDFLIFNLSYENTFEMVNHNRFNPGGGLFAARGVSRRFLVGLDFGLGDKFDKCYN